jgi:ankyrin repeat protein
MARDTWANFHRFQWINCQIDHLCKFKTHNAIRDALQHLPRTLEDTYLRILQNIDQDYTETAQKILKWLVRGTRELTLTELASAIAINPADDNESLDPDDIMDPEDILGYCGSLIVVSDDQKVSLAHFTVKEFLTSSRIKETLSIYYVGNEEVHAELAQVCLTYLGYMDFDRSPFTSIHDMTQFFEEFSFLEYASKSWAIHAQQVSNSENQIHDLIQQLLHSSFHKRENYNLWLQVCHSQHRHRKLSIAPPTHTSPLYYAASFGFRKIVQSLLEEGVDPMIGDAQTDNALSASVAEGHTEVVKILLERWFEGESKEGLGRYLYLAASRGHADLTGVLLDWGALIESRGGKYGTALQVAALEGHPDVVSVLLKRGANFKIVCARFGMPLSAAAEKGHRRVVQLLFGAGASANGRGGWYSTPLISATVGKDNSIINKMLDNGANVNAQGGRHDCALMAAAALGKIDLIKRLIGLGARINDENDKGADALHAACCAGRLDVVELLLASGADVNAKGGKHRNALNAACANGYPEIVQALLIAGADPHAFDSHYGNCLQAAVFYNHRDIVQCLAKAGVDVNAVGGVRGSALVCAARAGNLEMVELLASLGVPTGDTQDMSNAFIMATHKQHEFIMRYMISNGINIETLGQIRSNEWVGALDVAAHEGNQHLLETLVSLGANVKLHGGLYGTCLIAAIDSDHCSHKVIDAIIAHGANVNQKVVPARSDKQGCALNAAINRADLNAVTILLDHGADPNLINGRQPSPLMLAVQLGNEVIMDMLLGQGADINLSIDPCLTLKDDTGVVSALDVAAQFGHTLIIHRLVENGALLIQSLEKTAFKTPLQCAAYYAKAESVSTLLGLGSDVHIVGGTFGSALQAAAVSGSTECITLLLEAGADIDEHQIGKVRNTSDYSLSMG